MKNDIRRETKIRNRRPRPGDCRIDLTKPRGPQPAAPCNMVKVNHLLHLGVLSVVDKATSPRNLGEGFVTLSLKFEQVICPGDTVCSVAFHYPLTTIDASQMERGSLLFRSHVDNTRLELEVRASIRLPRSPRCHY